jgi:peroxiredoxin
MTIQEGDKIPDATLMHMTDSGPAKITTQELFGGKKVALFAVPGAFTPTCSAQHLPGFVDNADAIKAMGVDTIACLAVNDAFVMGAWGKDRNVGDKVLMLADGNGELTGKLGLDLDATGFGLGSRSQRYSMIVNDGVVTKLNVEAAGAFEASKAEVILDQLG